MASSNWTWGGSTTGRGWGTPPKPKPVAKPTDPNAFSKVSVAPGYDPATLQPLPDPPPGHDAGYENAINQIGRSSGNSLADVQYDDTTGHQKFGLRDDGTVDASNPFSRAMLLQRSYDIAKRGTTNGLAARGQLYSGAMANAQDANTFGFQQGDNSLRSDFRDFQQSLIQRRRDIGEGVTTGTENAGADELGRIPQASGDPLPLLPDGVSLAKGVKLGAGIRVVKDPATGKLSFQKG